MSYEQELIEKYKGVKARLFGMPKKPKPVIITNYSLPSVPTVELKPEPRPDFKPVSVKVKILHDELERLGMTQQELFGYSREKKYHNARREIWYKMRQAGYSFNQIARICRPDDPYDHTTVLHGIRKYEQELGTETV